LRRVKIYGAGSIGNHLSNAARRLGYSVDICDVDAAALQRTRDSIYPGRYGSWDDAIKLHRVGEEPKSGYDYIFIGTPPDSHVKLARAALLEKPIALLVEKPLCPPDLDGVDALRAEAASAGVAVFVGYDHVVGQAAEKAAEVLRSGLIGQILTIDVEFREYWGGIFAAHPWLSGPAASYLGYWRRGGGALGEHSHALNLWQFFAHTAGLGRVQTVQAAIDYVADGQLDYDRVCFLNLATSSGTLGRVVQDVVTHPPRKWARIQGTAGHVEWHCGYEPGVDLVRFQGPGKDPESVRFAKTRPDDFIRELTHIDAALREGTAADSPIRLERGLETMRVISAAHQAAAGNGRATIRYGDG
jgi:predicted dehydrogenase